VYEKLLCRAHDTAARLKEAVYMYESLTRLEPGLAPPLFVRSYLISTVTNWAMQVLKA
jgi:hypothetical protein